MKLDDIPFVIYDIQKEMPKHTSTTLEIPHSYGHMPKNLKDYSNKVMDKYLNNHLAVIEEIAHQFPNHGLPKWMKQYANKYYKNADILGRDRFFNNPIRADFSDTRNIGANGVYEGQFIQYGIVKGAQLDFGADTSSDFYNDGSGAIRAGKATGGTIGQYYDQIAFHTDATVTPGNMSLGAYQDSSSTPAARYTDTGTFTSVASDFTYHALTEFSLLQTSVWLAWQVANSSNFGFFFGATGQSIYQHNIAYAVPMVDPFGGGSASTNSWHMKIAHS